MSVHVAFDPDSIDWLPFFQSQMGGGYFFEGQQFQRGNGLSSVFSTIFRYLLPIGKTIGKELGKEGIQMSSRVLNRLAGGENLRDSLVTESQKGLKNVVDQVYARQKGQGRRRKKSLVAIDEANGGTSTIKGVIKTKGKKQFLK